MSDKKHDITIIAGISGVGKSYIIRKLQEKRIYTHYSAGTLIGKRNDARRDELRLGSLSEIIKNQVLLMEQFTDELIAACTETPVLFDAHMLIDNESMLVEVPLEIFRGLNPSRIIYIHEDSPLIAKRRANDLFRKRPSRNTQQLDEQQEQSIKLAQKHCEAMGIPCIVIKGANLSEIELAMKL